jgi:hypothetical protein
VSVLETIDQTDGLLGPVPGRERGHGPQGFLPGEGGGKVRQQDSYTGEVKPVERTTAVY